MIKELPVAERPREKMLAKGPEYLSNAELIAIIIRTGTNKKSAITIANEIISQCSDGVSDLFNKTINEFCEIDGVGPSKACQLMAALELSKRAMLPEKRMMLKVTSPEIIFDFFKLKLRHEKVEKFIAVFLNTKNTVIKWDVISVGTLNASIVHPREVFNKAISHNAASLIVVHNHPSGNPSPSREDFLVTERLIEAGKIIGITVLDHIVIGHDAYYSFKESSDLF